jgi:hypothetical protein
MTANVSGVVFAMSLLSTDFSVYLHSRHVFGGPKQTHFAPPPFFCLGFYPHFSALSTKSLGLLKIFKRNAKKTVFSWLNETFRTVALI